jgi:site-specific recombinase XerD
MATIHKRKLRSGEVVWELTHGTGSDRRRFTAGRTREEAQAVLRQFEQQLALHGDAPKDDSVGAVLGQYVKHLEANRRRGTCRRYVRVLKTFHQCFLARHYPDVQQIRQVRPFHLEEYKRRRVEGSIQERASDDDTPRERALRAVLAQGVKAAKPQDNAQFGWLGRKRLARNVTRKTVNYELQVLQTFFRWAVAQNRLFINPTVTVERFRIPKRALPKFLTTEELNKLFTACTEEERRLFMTILFSGMRRGEVEHLTWDDVRFDLGVIFIQEKPDLNWKPKTDERLIPMSQALRTILLQQHANRISERFVFPNKEGNRETHLLDKLRKVCRRAGITTTTVHALRHSFGAHLRMAGVSLADIGDLLGHKDLATTQIYAKVHQQHLREVISKLSSVVDTDSVNRRLLESGPSTSSTAPPDRSE